MDKKPAVLCILDGWGINPSSKANAVALADTPHFDKIWNTMPRTQLVTHGEDVGLPNGQMGNSEVGHTNIGAGRVIWMDLPRIDNAIKDGSFKDLDGLQTFIAKLKTSGGTAHLAGLVSKGGVHAHSEHMLETARVCRQAGLNVKIHVFSDGRDVPPESAKHDLPLFQSNLPKGAEIATLTGRFFALDRDNRWERVEKAYRAVAYAEGDHYSNINDAIDAPYAEKVYDEFIPASVIGDYQGMKDGDALFFLNFRADRAREIIKAFLEPNFDAFETGKRPQLSATLGMVTYSKEIDQWMPALFPPREIKMTLGEYVSKRGLTQLRLAETEKYPHVTFFFNGGIEPPYPGEDRYLAPSPKVRTYDLKPEMSSAEIGDELERAILAKEHDLIIVNFANPDMVGHTGDLDAAIKACASVDLQLGRAIKAIEATEGSMLVTADHGNCEVMVDPITGEPHTAHTLNPVPLILVGGKADNQLNSGKLGDLAPTLLTLMGLSQPNEMTGQSLISSGKLLDV